jgi:hypothetical protein
MAAVLMPRDFLERCLVALDAWEPRIGAFVTLNLAEARAAADRSTARWRAGNPLSPIDGMPLGIKDIIETADMPTQNGSPLFAGFRSERDAASVAALREAGGVIIGKTVTTEFAATEPRGTRNPWDPTRTPGGSSSGSATAVGPARRKSPVPRHLRVALCARQQASGGQDQLGTRRSYQRCHGAIGIVRLDRQWQDHTYRHDQQRELAEAGRGDRPRQRWYAANRQPHPQRADPRQRVLSSPDKELKYSSTSFTSIESISLRDSAWFATEQSSRRLSRPELEELRTRRRDLGTSQSDPNRLFAGKLGCKRQDHNVPQQLTPP